MKSGEITDRGVIRLLGNILASSAQGSSSRETDVRQVNDEPIQETLVQLEQETAIVESVTPPPLNDTETAPEIVTENVIPSEITPNTEKSAIKKSKILPLIILLIALLIIASVAAWFFLQNKDGNGASSANAACEVKSGADEIAFIQECLKTNPDTKQLLAIINDAKKNNACGVAQRLYANKAQGGNAEIAFTYAKEYDEAFSKGEGCFKLDKETALYWYETGLNADPNNAEAKQRVAELKK